MDLEDSKSTFDVLPSSGERPWYIPSNWVVADAMGGWTVRRGPGVDRYHVTIAFTNSDEQVFINIDRRVLPLPSTFNTSPPRSLAVRDTPIIRLSTAIIQSGRSRHAYMSDRLDVMHIFVGETTRNTRS
jgi:hypothetical protein